MDFNYFRGVVTYRDKLDLAVDTLEPGGACGAIIADGMQSGRATQADVRQWRGFLEGVSYALNLLYEVIPLEQLEDDVELAGVPSLSYLCHDPEITDVGIEMMRRVVNMLTGEDQNREDKDAEIH